MKLRILYILFCIMGVACLPTENRVPFQNDGEPPRTFATDNGSTPHEAKPKTEKACVNEYCFESILGPNSFIRYTKDEQVISRNQFIDLLIDSKDFRSIVNQSIATLETPKRFNSGYMIWAPVINASTKDMAMYFLAKQKTGFDGQLDKHFIPQFKHCEPGMPQERSEDYSRFYKLFAFDGDNLLERSKNDARPNLNNGSVIFQGGRSKNPGEIMVSPCPINNVLDSVENKPLMNVYSFAAMLNNTPSKMALLNSFWYAVGQTARLMFDGNKIKDLHGDERKILLLNTHGHGVHYLHFRLDTEISDFNHYNHADSLGTQMMSEQGSQKLYQTIFK